MSDRGGDTTRDVLLRVRVENLSTAGFGQVSEAVRTLTASLESQIAAANKAQISERELTASITKLDQAAKSLTGLATAIDQFKNFDKVLASADASVERARVKLADYRLALEQTGDTSDKAQRRLTQLVAGYEREQATLARQQQAYADLSARLQKADIDTGNLAAAEENLKLVAEQTGQALTRLNQAKLDYAQNSRLAREAAVALREEQVKAAATAKAEAEAIELIRTARAREAGELRATLSGMMAVNRETAAAEQAKYQSMFASAERFNNEMRDLNRQRHANETAEARAAANEARVIIQQRAAEQRKFMEAQTAQLRQFNEETRLLNRQRSNDEANAAVAAQRLAMRPAGPVPTVVQAQAGGTAQARVVGNAPGLFGLRPYELQNLSYQINDIVSGLAMGQRVSQIFAQQGGQVLQLFNRSIFSLVQYLPQIALLAGAATIAIAALNRAFSSVSSVREFSAAITLSGQGSLYNATQLTELRKRVQDLGVSWKDSGDIIKQAVSIGVQPELLDLFTKAARDMALANGISVPEAMKKLVTEFGHGFEAIEKNDEVLRTLTIDEYKELKALSDAGGSREAARRALELYAATLRDAAEKAQTPWNKAVTAMGAAWHTFLDQISPISTIESLARGLDHMTEGMKRVNEEATKNPGAVQNFFNRLAGTAIGAGTGLVAGGIAGGPVGGIVGGVAGGVAGYSASGTGGGTVASGAIRSGSNEAGVQLWLANHGYSANAIAAIMGNASVESGFDPSIRNPTGHFGLFQWDKERQASLGGSTSITTQMELMDRELSKLDPAFKTAADSAGVLAARFEKIFERSSGSDLAKRISEAQRFSSGVGPPVAPPPSEGRPDAVTTGQGTVEYARAKEALKELTDAETRRNTVNRQAIIDLEEETARKKTNDLGSVTQEIAAEEAVNKKKAEFAELDRQRANEQDVLNKTYGHNRDAILKAGAEGRAKEFAIQKEQNQGIVNDQQVYDAGLKAQREKVAEFAKERESDEQIRAIRNQAAALDRANTLKSTTELAKALQGVDDQYVSINANLEKHAKEHPEDARTAEILKQVEALKQVAIANETVQSYEASAKAALTTRTTLVQTYANLAASGDITIGEQEAKTKAAFDLTSGSIRTAANNLEAFLKTAEGLALPPERIALLTAKVAELRSQANYVSPLFKAIKESVEQSFTTGLATAFNTIAEAVGGLINKTKTWKDVLDATKTAAINFFAQLLKDIATAILKYEALKLASSLFGIGGGGTGGGGGGILSALFGIGGKTTTGALSTTSPFGDGWSLAELGMLHAGGVVGRTTLPRRTVPVSWFAGAPRYHSGTVVGLAPDEQAAILRKGEEVLTGDNPRNIMNMRGSNGGAGGPVNIRSVLVMNESQIPAAMAGSHGEEVVVAHLVRNAATIRALVKG